jgi:hypothetical protein
MNRRNIFILIALAIVFVGAMALFTSRHHNNTKGTTAQSTTQFTFKELGLKVALPQNLKGLSYDVSDQTAKPAPPLLMRLKINSFTTAVNQCLGVQTNTYQDFATIIKQPGDYDSSPYKVGEKIKQFNSYYLADVGSSLPKDFKCLDNSKTASVRNLSQDLKKSLIQAFNQGAM